MRVLQVHDQLQPSTVTPQPASVDMRCAHLVSAAVCPNFGPHDVAASADGLLEIFRGEHGVGRRCRRWQPDLCVSHCTLAGIRCMVT